jgi:hypothetical protein
VNAGTGALTTVGVAPLTTALAGTAFGFDFNPTVDRIRVTSDAEQSLRLHPDMGTVAGIDTSLAPAGNVVAVAYTNSRDGAVTTTLFGIDSASDKLVLVGGIDGVPSPNAGVVADVGALGVDTSANAGFDIRPPMNVGYAVLSVAGVSGLYTVNLATGAAAKVADIGNGVVLRSFALAQ